MTISKSEVKKYVLPSILVLGLFLPVFDARAAGDGWFSLGEFTYGAVTNLFAYSLSWFFIVLGKLLGILVSMLDWVVRIRIYTDLPVIQSSWKIMRDFANMLFIIALVVMAYGTIFNIPKYDFRSLIGRFIVIAVLINFSLVLGGLMIDATQVLNNTFLNAMGDISGRLGQGLNPTALLADPKVAGAIDKQSFVDLVGGSIVTLFFGIWFLLAFIVSVAVPLAVAFVRIPVLWALLIVSPMAWLLSILPATKRAYDAWWHQFLAWNLFLPYYLFFLYFALFFLSQQDVVLAGLLRGPTGQAIVDQKFDKFGIQSSVTFGLLFYYILIGIFLIGGTKVAMSAGRFSGTGIVSAARWGRDRVAARVGWTAAIRAGKGRFEEAGEREEARISRQAAFMREGLGYVTGGRKGFVEEQQAKDVAAAKKKFERLSDQDLRNLVRPASQLNKTLRGGQFRDQLAIRELLKQRGLLGTRMEDGTDEYAEMFDMYGGNKTVAGRQLAASFDYNKMSPDQRERWYDLVIDISTKRKISEAMADKGDRFFTDTRTDEATAQTQQNIQNALQYFATAGEQREFLKKIEKHSLELAVRVGLQNKLLTKEGKILEDFETAVKDVIRKMSPDALLEATKGLTSFAKNDERKKWVMDSLNLQKIEAMLAKGTQQQLDAWKEVDKNKFDAEKIQAEKERKARELAEVTGKATGEAIARAGGLGGGGGPPPQGTPPAPAQPRRPAGFVRPGEGVQQGNVVDLRNRENQ